MGPGRISLRWGWICYTPISLSPLWGFVLTVRFVIALRAPLVPAPSSVPLPCMSLSSALQFRCLCPFTFRRCAAGARGAQRSGASSGRLASILVTQASSQGLLVAVLPCISCFSGNLAETGRAFPPQEAVLYKGFLWLSPPCPVPQEQHLRWGGPGRAARTPGAISCYTE